MPFSEVISFLFGRSEQEELKWLEKKDDQKSACLQSFFAIKYHTLIYVKEMVKKYNL